MPQQNRPRSTIKKNKKPRCAWAIKRIVWFWQNKTIINEVKALWHAVRFSLINLPGLILFKNPQCGIKWNPLQFRRRNLGPHSLLDFSNNFLLKKKAPIKKVNDNRWVFFHNHRRVINGLGSIESPPSYGNRGFFYFYAFGWVASI